MKIGSSPPVTKGFCNDENYGGKLEEMSFSLLGKAEFRYVFQKSILSQEPFKFYVAMNFMCT